MSLAVVRRSGVHVLSFDTGSRTMLDGITAVVVVFSTNELLDGIHEMHDVNDSQFWA